MKDKGFTITIICNVCGSENGQLWDWGRDGEYEGKVAKCPDCGEREHL